MEQIGLHLDSPPAGGIDPRAVIEALAGLLKLVNAVEGEEDQLKWITADLSMGSVSCALRPAPGQEASGRQRMRIIWEGAQLLQSRPGIPTGWNERALEVFLGLTNLTGYSGVEATSLTTDQHQQQLRLDDTVREHVEGSLRGAAESLSTVRGVIVRYLNDRGRREFGIRGHYSGRSLRVLFPSSMDHDVKTALLDNRPVSVRGVLRRNSEGQGLALAAEQLTVLPVPTRPTARARDMIGVLGTDWTGDLDSVEWVRSQRG